MKTTVQLLCMTCCERLSASDEVGGAEAAAALDAMAKLAGWVRIERRPKHPADVCTECAALISEAWDEVIDATFGRMKAAANASLSEGAIDPAAMAALIRSTER